MQLVAERAKYETFLRELDKDSASKPANVVARVRADYTARLESVVEKLKDNHDVLTEHAATLTAQLHKLQEAEKRFLDEAAELDLRKQVGEIPEEEWETAVERVKTDAAKIKSQQEVTAGDIKRIREMLGSIAPVAQATKPDADAAAAKPKVDELEFLKTVVGQTSGVHPTPPRPVAPPPPPPPPRTSEPKPVARTSAPTPEPPTSRPSVAVKPIGPPPRPSGGTVPPRPSAVLKESLIEPDPMSVPSAPVEAPPIVKAAAVPTPAKPSLIDGPQAEVKINPKVGDERPLASNVPTGELNLKARGVPGAKKTLKCPNCGALNNPSEWYCEQCGAELAQV